MKKLTNIIVLIVAALFIFSEVTIQAQTLVDDWGSTPRGSAWPILNDSDYVAGNAAMGDGAPPTAWASIRGGFDSLTATTTQAFVITGTLEFVGGGGGNAYTWLRYALFGEANDTLKYALTDSARWTENTNGNGYIFTPVTGAGTISNTFNTWPQGNQGTEWPLINSKSWNSTNSNGGGPFSTVLQAPYHQEATAGVYDWAISVQPLSSGGNEVRWYLIQQHDAGTTDYYWWGGSFTDTAKTATFNSIGFAVDNGNGATQINLGKVTVSLGDPIVIPEAPFEGFYVDMWGTTPRGSAWPILNDSDYVDGNAAMGDGAPPTAWASIRGGFPIPVTPTLDKAIIVSGQLQFVGGGGGNAYTWLRYALFSEAKDTLKYALTDSARWTETTNGNGYIFTPVTGAGTISNTYRTWPQGNQGTEWPLINSKSWNSTNNNGGGPFSTVLQAPYHQEATAGTYDWAISVQPLSGGGSEVRWYLIQQHDPGSTDYYWWGGSFTDTAVVDSFNNIGFAVDNGNGATQVNLTNVYVDKGDPITIPPKPFEAYYVDTWGFNGGTGGWALRPGELTGNVILGGTSALTGWAAVRGAFGPESGIGKDTALVITGNLEIVGSGFDGSDSLRFGLFYSDSAGTTAIDSASDSSYVWTGTANHHSGYLFLPPSGANNIGSWSGTQGSWGAVVDGKWFGTDDPNDYVLGSEAQVPESAIAGEGKYSFAISVAPQGDGTQEVKVNLIKEDGSYSWAAETIDNHSPLTTNKFNSIGFAVNSGSSIDTLKITNVKVDLTSPITGIKAPGNNGGLPTQFSLSQNYPNPFNPSTTIRFALPKSGDVSLVVYDILGRKVATILNENLKAGHHIVRFNASNLASGVYFYRIKAGDFIGVKKLMLLK